MNNIGIIGNGFVGKATKQIFDGISGLRVVVYDIVPELCEPTGITIGDIRDQCDIVFVCVPTPVTEDNVCHTEIVESCVHKLLHDDLTHHRPMVVVRSTVPPGTCERLGVNHMPEFLREKHWQHDVEETDTILFGGADGTFTAQQKTDLQELFDRAKQSQTIKDSMVLFASTRETELAKYARNAFLATKVAFFNELYDYSLALGLESFENVRQFVTMDPRIGDSHSNVPGHDGRKGYGGTCLPKDTCVLQSEMTQAGVETHVVKGAWLRNIEVDRTERDWEHDVGRSFI